MFRAITQAIRGWSAKEAKSLQKLEGGGGETGNGQDARSSVGGTLSLLVRVYELEVL